MPDLEVPESTVPTAQAAAEGVPASTRRDALRNGLVTAGLVAVAARGTRGAVGTVPRAPGTHRFTLRALDLRSDANGRLAPGDRAGAYAELLDENGEPVGRFYATMTAVDDWDDDVALAQELHTFQFADASLVGAGVSTLDDENADTFAVIGGTGKYLGARGQYVASLRHADFGGDGSARFELTIIVDKED
jgi:hypothetical protein